MNTLQLLDKIYLDYVNNFITIQGMASYYNLDTTDMGKLIGIARKVHKRLNKRTA